MPSRTCCASARTSRWSGPADPGAARRQAARAPHQGHRPDDRRRGRPDQLRALRPRVRRRQPLHPRRARGRHPHRRRAWCCTPATSRWTSSRSTAGSPTCARSPGSARRASTCSSPTRPTPRSPASRPRRRRSPRCWSGSSTPAARRIIVACFASHVHRVQQVMDAAVGARPQGGLRRQVDGAQHGRSPATSATSTCPRAC